MKKIGVIERVNSLTPEKFHSQYVVRNNPVIIRNALTSWRGYQLWSLDYFVKTIGDIKIRYYISESNLYPDLSSIETDKLNQKEFFNEGTLAHFIALLKEKET